MRCALRAISWIPIIPSSSSIATAWDRLVMLAVLYVATFTPLQVCARVGRAGCVHLHIL